MSNLAGTCFVIMPFGEKENVDGKMIDFDKIYKFLIKNTVEKTGLKCVRCDEIAESGWIHKKMFSHIYDAEVAVVDITSLNPNVFYELGVRHALVNYATILLRRKGTKIPFNIQDFQIIEYDPEDIENIEDTRKKIIDFIRNALNLRKIDSPVHEVLSLRIGTIPKQLTKTEVYEYKLRKVQTKSICLITGDLRDVKGIDVWVINPAIK